MLYTTHNAYLASYHAYFLTNNRVPSIAHSPALSSILQQLGSSDMSLKTVHV